MDAKNIKLITNFILQFKSGFHLFTLRECIATSVSSWCFVAANVIGTEV